ncbi:glucuronate isomerase, partial [Salmonella enterica subsp. enterica serovar Typhimurium]|uniref:glucuronate isomerase n=1 Tax=Salmonella enterica TaxID=28901 RepID=UPI0007A890E5
ARGIMQQMNVRRGGTTDDPNDSLEYHRQIAADDSIDFEVAPSWRPDKVFNIELDGFGDFLRKLEAAAVGSITRFDDLR